VRFFLTQRRWIIGLFAGFLTLLLLCGCESRNTVENASFLEYEYPQLGLIVELSYDRWKHPGSHHLSYVTPESVT